MPSDPGYDAPLHRPHGSYPPGSGALALWIVIALVAGIVTFVEVLF